MFENPGKTVQKIAETCFALCLIIAVILFIIGGVRILSEVDSNTTFGEILSYTAEDYARGLSKGYDWLVNGYKGKMQCKTAIYIALGSLSSIPMYAFGCLVEDVAAIREKLRGQEKQNTDND